MDTVNNNASVRGTNSAVDQEQPGESTCRISSVSRRAARSDSTETIRRQSKYNLRSRSNASGPGEAKEDEPIVETPNCALKRKSKATPMSKLETGNWSGDAAVDFGLSRNLNEITMMATILVALPFVLYGIMNVVALFLDLFYWCTWMWTICFCLAFYFNDITATEARRIKDIVRGVLLFLLFFMPCSDSAETVTGQGHSKSKVTRVHEVEHEVEIVEITSVDQSEPIEQAHEAV